MTKPTTDASRSHDMTFSLVQGGPPYRIQQKVGLIPRRGLGTPRRMIFFILVTWAPMMVWAFINKRLFPGAVAEPLLQHFGVHVRCLVAIPLFIAAEAVAEAVGGRLFPYFVTSGLVTDASCPCFVEILRQAARLRDSWLASALLAVMALLLAWHFTGADDALHADALSWAVSSEAGRLRVGFGGWWFRFVVAPVFASQSAHQILYHGAHVIAFQLPLAVFAAAMLVIFLGPFLLFSPPLRQPKRRSLLEYGALVGEHGWLVQKRWILGEPVEDKGLLDAPELGPVADTITMYEAVQRIKLAPLSLQSVAAIVAPAVLPMIPVFAIEVPVKQILLNLLGVLI